MGVWTSFLNLFKPDRTENYNVITQQNDNWDKIDSGVKAVSDDLGNPSSASAVTGADAFSKIATLNRKYSDVATNGDLNDYKESGKHYCNGVVNSPNGSSVNWGVVDILGREDKSYARQLWYPVGSNDVYIREFRNSVWGNWAKIIPQTVKKLSMSLPSTADVFNVALNRTTDFVIGIHVKNANGDWLDNNYTTVSDGKPIVSVLHSGYMRLNFADYVSKDMEILYIHM